MAAKIRVIGYARESTKDQAINGFNLDDQEKKIIQYAEIFYEKGSYDLEVYREEGASAKSLSRPKMDELIKMVKQKSVDVIIIHNLDRLTRQVRDLAELLEIFDQYGVSLISITEKIDTKSPMGRFFIFLIVLIAQWEWETISSRSRRGIEESTRQGNYTLPGAPLGYRRDPDNSHKLIVEEKEAVVIKSMFENIAFKDYSLETLAEMMTQDHILDRKWGMETVRKIIDNKIYYGTLERFGVEYKNNTIPIISEDLYKKAHGSLKNHHVRQTRQYVYKGLIVCGKCGGIMSCHSSQSRTGDLHYYYRCRHCKCQVSENDINEKYVDTFDQMIKESKFAINYETIKIGHENISEILETIPSSSLSYGMNVNHLVSIYGKTEADKSKLEMCLKAMTIGIDSLSFAALSFRDKRVFLKSRIDSIKYDMRSKDTSIVFIDNPV